MFNRYYYFQICFRVIIQLCGLYDYPILAVKTYSFMKKTGVEWNAVTYGAYNKVRKFNF